MTNPLEITLVHVPAPTVYRVMHGTTFMGQFTQVGEPWNGLLHLKETNTEPGAGHEEIVVCAPEPSRAASAFDITLGRSRELTGRVIKASLSFFDALRIADTSPHAHDSAATPKQP